MIFTLLPFLKHHYPQYDVSKHFTQETIDRSEHLIFDETSMMVVDKESSSDVTDTELLGFEISLKPSTSSPPATQRPSEQHTNDGMPAEDDSISTLGAAPSMFEVPSVRNIATTPFSPNTNSSTSITSNSSTVTAESLQSLQSQLQDLNSRLDRQESDTQSKLDQIFQLMSQKPSSGGVDNSHAGHSGAGGGDTAGAQS